MNDPGKKRLGLSAKIFLGTGSGYWRWHLFWGIHFVSRHHGRSLYSVAPDVGPSLRHLFLDHRSGTSHLSRGPFVSQEVRGVTPSFMGNRLIHGFPHSLAFPDWESASFFSSTLVDAGQEVDFLNLYIPANPFHSLSNAIIPAVVLFSIIAGVALIGVERKQVLLDPLSALLEVLTRVTGFVIQLAPLGVFAISASAAGTMQLEDLGRLQVYLLTYITASLV